MATNRRGKEQLSPEELALIRAQTQRLGAETAQGAADTQAKLQIARETLANESAQSAAKVGLGQQEIGSKEKLGKLSAALDALGLGSKERIAREGDQNAIASDIARRTDLTPDVVAGTLAEGGNPAMYNALAVKKAADREKGIAPFITPLQQASSDTERSKTFKAALDAIGPGAYDEAVARAFPKPENAAVRTAGETPERFKGTATTTGTGGTDFGALAATLLGQGSNATANAGTSVTLPSPEITYTGIGHGALEGTRRTDVGNRSQLELPSGGYAEVAKPKNVTADALLTAAIAPRGTPANAVTTESNVSPTVNFASNIDQGIGGARGVPNVEPAVGGIQPTIPPELLATGPSMTAPTPTPASVVASTATPVPQPIPQLTPDAMAFLLKQKQQQVPAY